MTAVESSSSIHVEWTMLTDSYETGPVFNYTIQATASDHATVTTEVIGRYKYIQGVTWKTHWVWYHMSVS